MFQSIFVRLRNFERRIDIGTDLMAEYGVHLWHSLLYFLNYLCCNGRKCSGELWTKFKAWFDKVTDGDYDPQYEDDIIVKMWEQKFGGAK